MMPDRLQSNVSTRHRLWLVAALCCLLLMCYLLTYTGVTRSGDEDWIVDTTESLAIHGNVLLNQTVHLSGLKPTDVEPAQPLLAAPLYWLAYQIPWLGNVHTVLLFNPLVTVLTAALLFFTAVELNYDDKVAVIASLAFGLTTISWPYTQTFFREPLAGLTLLGAALAILRWHRALREGSARHWLWLAVALALTVVMVLTKEVMLAVVPVLLVLAYPGRRRFTPGGRTLALGAVAAVILAALVIILLVTLQNQTGMLTARYDFGLVWRRFLNRIPDAWMGLAGYLVSPGKAIWWFSPIVILSLTSPLLLPKGRWRESWIPLATLAAFVAVYSTSKGEIWHGGAGWGARFLVPTVPMLMVGTLPALKRITAGQRSWPRLALLVVLIAGLAVQLVGNYVNIYSYYAHAEANTGQPVWLGPAIWSPRWSQIGGSLLFLPQAETSIRWLLPSPDWLTLGAIIATGALATFSLLSLLRRDGAPGRLLSIGIRTLPVLALGVVVLALWRAYDDPRYDAGNLPLVELRETLQRDAAADDKILLSTPYYVPHFANYYKGRTTWYGLALSPGERYSFEEEPRVASDQVEDLVAPTTVEVFKRVVYGGDLYAPGLLWMVVDSGPFHPWSTRPPEWYFAKYSYVVGNTEFSPEVRLVKFLPLPAPAVESEETGGEIARVGDSMRLLQYALQLPPSNPTADTLRPGDQLGVALIWEAAAPVGQDYTVAVHMMSADGQLLLQQDRAPQGGFRPTGSWQEGEQIEDNYGFVLPTEMPQGEYQLWLVVYSYPSLERLPITGPDGEPLGDHLVLDTLRVSQVQP